MFKRLTLCAIGYLLSILITNAQTISQPSESTFDINPRFFTQLDKKTRNLQENIQKKTLRSLQALQKQELKLQKKLVSKDSIAAKGLLETQAKFKLLEEQIKQPPGQSLLKEYIPSLDSLTTCLKFLSEPQSLTSKFPSAYNSLLAEANTNVQQLSSRLEQAADVRQFMKERKLQIKEQLERYGMGKELKKINKEVYYYQQQISEYKAMLKDKKKLEQKALAALQKIPAFRAFMQKHSQLAQLFRVPENYGTPESLAGLQTRASVQAEIQSRFATSGVNPQNYIQGQVQQAQGELNKFKEKISALGGGNGSDIEMPDFKPNSQKTKTFLKRIEVGTNIQSHRPNGLLPVTSDIAVTLGYKLNDRSVIGIAAAYKMGWGKDWKHIKITHEGVGFRSYIDWKLAPIIGKMDGFWITGGYERNYHHSFTRIEQLKQLSTWQTSGLLGLTKKYKLGKKTNTIQVLWDFLSYKQMPQTPAVVWRVGVKL